MKARSSQLKPRLVAAWADWLGFGLLGKRSGCCVTDAAVSHPKWTFIRVCEVVVIRVQRIGPRVVAHP